jgi:hypothetical protein
VIDLVIQNKALLFKHLHKFFNKADVPWVDLTWKAHYSASLAPQARNLGGHFGGELCVDSLTSKEQYQRK